MAERDRAARNEAAYDSMNTVAFLVIPFFVVGVFFGVKLREDWALRGPLGVIADFWVGLALAAVGTALWMRWCRRRGRAAWIRWAPAWAFLGSFVLGLVPGIGELVGG